VIKSRTNDAMLQNNGHNIAAFGEYLFNSTRVRRNESLISALLPGPK